ncbi:MAG: EFR1 family ferrodoxin [Lachnospiraceae bacterium]|nr:EFR1 family ferrodoxin [Lachnospiraceae bacterium]
MKVSQIVFSPTGGTGKVAEIVANAFSMPISKIDLSNAKTDYSSLYLTKDDIAIIAVPSYGGRVPGLATQRISNIHADQTLCIIICVYGNRAYEDTLIELKDIAEKSGFKVIAAIAAIAEHSIMHQYAAGRPDAKDQNELNGFAAKILEKISGNSGNISIPQVPGNRPYKHMGTASLVPKAGNHCTSCGYCAEQCPAEAINQENLKVADSKKCISCMRCVVQCPQSARKVNGALVSVAALAIKKACSTRKENELFI